MPRFHFKFGSEVVGFDSNFLPPGLLHYNAGEKDQKRTGASKSQSFLLVSKTFPFFSLK